MAPPLGFPLRKGFFGDVSVSPDEQGEYRKLVAHRVKAALSSEQELLGRDLSSSRRQAGWFGPTVAAPPPRLQAGHERWKRVMTQHSLHIYRRQRGSGNARINNRQNAPEDNADWADADDVAHRSMLGLGRVQGTVEDLLYGWYDASHDEMKASTAFLNANTLDCTTLATLETAADSNEDGSARHAMHYLGLKWVLSKFPLSFLLAPRDWCYVEALGVTRDSLGREVGYCVQHSVPVESCKPFDASSYTASVVRGRMSFTYLFRETTPGFVDVFARGAFDLAGHIPMKVTAYATAKVLTSLFDAVSCAQAKKLTLTMLANRQHGSDQHEADRPSQTTMPCTVCRQSVGAFARRHRCYVCSNSVCTKCITKRRIFVRNKASTSSESGFHVEKVDTCMTCVIAAGNMTDIRPADAEFSIVRAEQHFTRSNSTRTTEVSDDLSGKIELTDSGDDIDQDIGDFITIDRAFSERSLLSAVRSVSETDDDEQGTTLLDIHEDRSYERASYDGFGHRPGHGPTGSYYGGQSIARLSTSLPTTDLDERNLYSTLMRLSSSVEETYAITQETQKKYMTADV